MIFCDWDHRPAVLYGARAFAILEPGGPWVAVDFWDVRETAAILWEEAWRERFEQRFGPLGLPGDWPGAA